ncbi:hypothetical protein KSC_014850 [Ktedonobacter sp. SOSP1-52]|nr:hypothetical protein KSC_014850 [Ktedonobacter sp. SOSP1-52]
MPEGTVERMISDELAAKIAEVNDVMVQEASRNNKHEVTALLQACFFCLYLLHFVLAHPPFLVAWFLALAQPVSAQ